jgi:hypothetical protein
MLVATVGVAEDITAKELNSNINYLLPIALTLHHLSDISKLDRTVLNEDLKIS